MKINRAYIYFVILLIVGMIAILQGAYFYMEKEVALMKKNVQEQMMAVANLKVRQIMSWRDEMLGSAETVMDNPLWINAVKQVIEDPDKSPETRTDILKWMEAKRKVNHLKNVLLIKPDGKVLLTLDTQDITIGAVMHDILERSARLKTIEMSDLHTGSKQFIHMDIVIPLIDQRSDRKEPLAFFWFRIDPYKFLYPALQTWPTLSPSAETILVEKEGDKVVYLNELRHKKGTALLLKAPVNASELPAAMATRGVEGLAEGKDYRGVKVLAYLKRIPRSPWFLITKMDENEFYTPIRREAYRISFLTGMVLLLFFASMGLLLIMESARFTGMKYEEELKRRAVETHFSYITKYANDFIILADGSFRIIEVNDRALAAYGYRRDEMIGMEAAILRAPETRGYIIEEAGMARRKDGAIFETVHMRKDGATFPVEISLRSIEMEGKTFYQSIIRDISERKKMEKALAESERKLRAIFEQTFQFIGLLTVDGTLIDANRAALELAGVPARNVLGRPFWDTPWWTHSPEEQERLRQAVKDAAKGEFVRFETTHLDRAGNTHYVDFSLKPVKDEKGNVIFLIPEGRDISERKKAEKELRLAFIGLRDTQLELMQSEKLAALGRFAAGIAHEVKNPMGIILGGAEYLEKKLTEADEDTRTAIVKIREAVIRGNSILQSLLQYAQPSALNSELLDPSDLVNDILSLVKYKDTFDKIKCFTEFHEEKIMVRADKNQIHQVLFNIIRNAGEAMPGGGTVTVRTYVSKDPEILSGKEACVIEIADTGPGIPKDLLQKVSEPFFTTKERKVGTGLGLFITKNIISNHKGRLIIDSVEGKGTTIKVVLPRAENA